MTDISAFQEAQDVLEGQKGVEEIRESIKAMQEELLQKSKVMFSQQSKYLFDTFPGLESFQWAQYTPYFNDGDECTFGVYAEDYFMKINGTSLEAEEGSDWEYHYEQGKGQWYTNKKNPALNGLPKTLSEFIYAFDPQVLKSMFGDHVYVTVYRDRVEVDECSHD